MLHRAEVKVWTLAGKACNCSECSAWATPWHVCSEAMLAQCEARGSKVVTRGASSTSKAFRQASWIDPIAFPCAACVPIASRHHTTPTLCHQHSLKLGRIHPHRSKQHQTTQSMTTFVCTYVSMYLCIYVYMYICIYVYMVWNGMVWYGMVWYV